MMDRKQELYSYLVDTLDQAVKVYRSLLDLIRKEKEILIAADLSELEESNRSKEAMLSRLKVLEQTRIKVARDLAKEVNGSVESPRLLELAGHFQGEQAEKLRNLHSVLELMLKRVSEFNKENEVLVQAALKNVGGAMDQIRATLQDKPTYQRKGGMANSSALGSAGQLVRKAI